MIQELVSSNLIIANAEADTWEEAVRIAGRLLYDNDYVEERYIQSMVDIVKEYGPYIVIDEGLALAHARPEDGARKLGLSFVTLKTPVEFGSEDNDPVKLVMGLSAVDADAHLDVMSELAELLSDEEIMKQIFEADSSEKIQDLISGICA